MFEGCHLRVCASLLSAAPWGADLLTPTPSLQLPVCAFLETCLWPGLQTPPLSDIPQGQEEDDQLGPKAPSMREVEGIYNFVLGHLLNHVLRDKSHPMQHEPTAEQ